jgi:hypothetical protein
VPPLVAVAELVLDTAELEKAPDLSPEEEEA